MRISPTFVIGALWRTGWVVLVGAFLSAIIATAPPPGVSVSLAGLHEEVFFDLAVIGLVSGGALLLLSRTLPRAESE